MDVMDRSSSDYTPAQEAGPKTSTDGPLLRWEDRPTQESWPSNPKTSTDGPLLEDRPTQEAWPSNPKTRTEFSTCKQFLDVIKPWLTSQGIVYDRLDHRGRPDEGGWRLPESEPGNIKITIWDFPTFFRPGGCPIKLADEIRATIVEINRIWSAAKEAFPNMDLNIEEYDESGGKIVYIRFPINEEALRRFLENDDEEYE